MAALNTVTTSNLTQENVPGDGHMIGPASTSLIGFYGVATPVSQRQGAAGAAVGTAISTSTSPFGFATSTQANAIVTLVNEIRASLVALGIMRGS